MNQMEIQPAARNGANGESRINARERPTASPPTIARAEISTVATAPCQRNGSATKRRRSLRNSTQAALSLSSGNPVMSDDQAAHSSLDAAIRPASELPLPPCGGDSETWPRGAGPSEA